MNQKPLSLFFAVLLLGGVIFAAHDVSARTMSDFQITMVPSTDFPQKYINALVFDVNVKGAPSTSDTLSAITFRERESARLGDDISAVHLWRDAQEAGFQGLGIDKDLGVMEWNGGCECLTLSNLAERVPAEGLRLFVSIDSGNTVTNGAKVQFELMKLTDADGDGMYEAGDTGVFFTSKDNGPADDLMLDSTLHRLIQVTRDIYPPVAVITNLTQKQALAQKAFTIKGVAKDQAGSIPQTVDIGINGVFYPAQITGDNYSTWEYEWKDIADGDYTLEMRASDYFDNKTLPGRKLLVSVDTTPDVPPQNPPAKKDDEPQLPPDEDEVFEEPGEYVYSLIKHPDSPLVYFLDPEDVLHPIPSEGVFLSWGFRWSDIETVTKFETQVRMGKPLPFPDGTLIKGSEAAVSVVIANGKRAWIVSEEVFLALGYRWDQIKVVADSDLTAYLRIGDITDVSGKPEGENLSRDEMLEWVFETKSFDIE